MEAQRKRNPFRTKIRRGLEKWSFIHKRIDPKNPAWRMGIGMIESILQTESKIDPDPYSELCSWAIRETESFFDATFPFIM